MRLREASETARSWAVMATGFCLLCLVGLVCGQPAAVDRDKAQREELLARMRKRASGTTVVRARSDDKPIAIVAEPLVRYTDQPRGITDATLWAFGGAGRPSALLKVEAYRKNDKLAWLYCLGSLDEEVIRAEWIDGHRWTAKTPGLEWKPLPVEPEVPAPADSERGRLSQMKALVRRFKVTATDAGRGKEEQRLLTQPVHRYADAKAGIVDGVIFGYTTYGTNPAALVLLEARKDGIAPATWHYAAARFSDAALVLTLDNEPVWSVEAAGNSAELESWLYFWESATAVKE